MKTIFFDFLENPMILGRELSFINRNGLLSYFGLKNGPRYKKG